MTPTQLKRIRKQLGLTLTEAGHKVGCSHVAILAFERGDVKNSYLDLPTRLYHAYREHAAKQAEFYAGMAAQMLHE